MGFRWPWTILLLGQQVAAHRCGKSEKTDAGGHSCGGRVDWLVQHEDLSKDEAGFRVAKEFPVECWRCGLNISSASSKSCSLQESTSDTLQLQQLQMMNCGKVQKASVQFQDVLAAKSDTWASSDQVKVWRQKSSLAGELCRESTVLLDHEEFKSAALVAMYAWSEVIMDGSQCCELLRPPYCLQAQWSWATLAVAILLGGSFLALISSLIAALTAKAPRPAARAAPRSPRPARAVPKPEPLGRTAEEIYQELLRSWMKDHSLRGLYGAAHFAESAASLFAQLYKRFGFQADNVRNQFDHLLSLWRSHCAMLADLDLEVEDEEELEEAVVNEKTLLHEALNSMHAELLEGFRAWRHRLSEELQEPLSRSSVTLCQVRWAQVPLGDWLDSESSPKHLAASLAMKHLAEVVTYLLVWGEAGNLRFMPEVIYFLTELTLGADGEPYQVEGPTSCCFLSRMIRPSYKVIFDEWYQSLEFKQVSTEDRASGVGPEEREKLPTFHTGYEAFLPPDAANYDDWNEFFANVGLLRRGMARLFESEHPKRFAVFQEFNLSKMLSSQKTKTHREVHSFWGVFASTHRIWLLHTLLFFTGLCVVAEEPKDDAETLAGHGIAVRFSGLGLLAPLHALMLMVARIYTSGPALRSSIRGIGCMCAHLSRGLLWLSPLVTYLAVRFSQGIDIDQQIIRYLLIAHGLVSVWALISLLFFANRTSDVPYQVRPRRLCRLQVVRYFFWFVVLAAKFLIAVVLFRAVFELILDLQLEPLGRATSRDVLIAWYSTVWTRDLLIWIWLWFSSFFIFCADTQLWFTVGCSLLGVAAFLSQRGCRVCHFALEDAVHELPWRFQEKVLRYAPSAKQAFAKTWNLVIHHMTKEQKINVRDSGELSYDYVMSEEPEPPVLFNRENCLERASKHYCYMSDTREWPVNKELQWRFLALSRGLGLPMPRPYRVPYVPTLTAVIPHFEEPILLQPEDLYSEAPGEARDLGHLIDYLRIKYMDEFKNLAQNFSVPGGVRNWSRYSPPQWKATCIWASMRLQTLWRTVAGICKYHDALLLLHELQGTCSGLLWHPEDTSDVFRCLVSMQLYSYSSSVQREQVNEMLERFPPNLKIAYIDHEDTDECAILHPQQRRRYYSCLIDRSCKKAKNSTSAFRLPLYRIELPGYPILSDGKADNQNHALPFSRGTITQCVDANQGAYFEQMLLLPNALGEFRWKAKRIVGFPEHITSDLGSVGDFAAGSETAFCTLLQRSYAVLGARMHYGHPDLMNKQYMMQQGGISKGTRTLNLSEDIFAGLDFVLRADGREICHKEYFHLSKGRDLGFNSVLKFFSKLSSGSGEQLLTRQMCRLGQLMSLPEVLTLYYAHAGYYLTQFLLSWVMPTVLFTWSLVLASDCDAHFAAFEPSCGRRPAPELMGRMLASIYTYALLVLVLLATALPLFMEEWLERSFKIAAQRLLKQVFTLSFLMFVFQAKIIGFYVVNELRYGGAKYISTGRSLPTERRPFIRPVPNKVDEYEGLYLDYAIQAFYDGLTLLIASIMVSGLGGMEPVNPYRGGLSALWACIGLTIISWLYAPFVFNPHQFARRHILEDRRVLCHFFWKNWGAGWIRWYEEYQLKPRTGLSISMLDFNFLVFFLGVSVWFAVVNHKVSMMQVIFSSQAYMKEVAAVTLLPPIFTSWISCFLVSQITRVVSSIRRRCCHAQGESTWDVLRPLVPFFAFLVVALEVFEALAALEILRRMQRWKDFLAGLILKYLLLEVTIFLAEGLMRSRCAKGCCGRERGLQALYFWILTNRMFRDMLTSSVILSPLLLLSLLNSGFRSCCQTLDLHEFLIYRSTGHRARRRACFGDSDRDTISNTDESQTTSTDASTDEEAPMAPRMR
ncbi:unnamed protein product [Durusdinium trenchii]|uniref:1,3-beta-glucan synthase n=1 Tax=Durusdinium trenchii TaxID=1381693 RepID=A0ABP0N8B4_9DINO